MADVLLDRDYRDYMSLNASQQKMYDAFKVIYPNYTHNQLITKVQWERISDEMTERGTKGINIGLLKKICERLNEYMDHNYPHIYEQVCGWTSTIDKINSWIEAGIELVDDIVDWIQELFN